MRRAARALAVAWTAAAGLAAAGLQEAGPRPVPADTLPDPLPRDVPRGLEPFADRAREPDAVVALGRRLFFSPELSRDRTVACASCHRPDAGFADTAARSLGVDGQHTLRNAPTLWNKALDEAFSWDGRAGSLAEQVLLPIENPLEMDLALDAAVARMAGDATWSAAFESALGAPPDRAGLARALAGFVAELTYGDTPVDRFRAGDAAALTPAERSGLWLFESKAGCWRCHEGARFSDGAFHNTGVGARDGVPEEGRRAVTGRDEDRGRFKTPGLRGLVHTAPYMHDGSLATLAEVVELYRAGGTANASLSPLVQPLDLTDAEAGNLVAFLRALSR